MELYVKSNFSENGVQVGGCCNCHWKIR